MTEAHEFALKMAETISGCLVKLGVSWAVSRSIPLKKDGSQMGIFSGILEAIRDFFGLAQLYEKYFPPKTEAQKEQDAQQGVKNETDKIKNDGRA